MTQHKKVSPFAICVDNSEYPVSLELHKIYYVIPDEDASLDGDLRIIDESGEDYLYPANYFILIELPHDTERMLRDSFSRSIQQVTAQSIGRCADEL
ncbi:hypothetical protein FJZ31_19725 [Candidatus Poribacteria bacterium]|nr:hypothetical protein [Candidatus Poribacteria bacterium]